MKAYTTLLKAADTEYVIQKSRFIGHATPVETEEEALRYLEAIRQEHKAANHNCYAYIIGENAGIMRYSDDGEPGGTAGLPIIEVMKQRGVVNCAVVVTRYFGGILLGAGGLVRAYSHTCALALNEASVCEMAPSLRMRLEVAYPQWDRVQHELKSLPVRQDEPEYTDSIRFGLLCKQTDAEQVLATLTRVTDGRIRQLAQEECYAPWEQSEPMKQE